MLIAVVEFAMLNIAGWSSPVARWAHNPKVGGSNPPPATSRGVLIGSENLIRTFLLSDFFHWLICYLYTFSGFHCYIRYIMFIKAGRRKRSNP